jgi:tRNA modification GTPase
LTATCEYEGIPVTLIDTAGEDDANTDIETASQTHRSRQTAEADLILHCIPVDVFALHLPQPDIHQPNLLIVTKADLATVETPAEAIVTSAATSLGLDTLRSSIAAELKHQSLGSDTSQVASHWRESLERAAYSLANAREAAAGPGGEELIAAELRLVIDDLGKVVGTVVTEDILDRIFRRFCIGK